MEPHRLISHHQGRLWLRNGTVSANAHQEASKHDLAALLSSLRELFGPASPLEHRRRDAVFFEYVLLAGVNDADDDAERLADIALSLACKVNLIGYNAVPGIPFQPAPRSRLLHFRDALARRGVTATIRESQGDDKSECSLHAGSWPRRTRRRTGGRRRRLA